MDSLTADTIKILDRGFVWIGGMLLLCLAAVGAAHVYTSQTPIPPCFEDEARIQWVMPDGKHTVCIAYDNLSWEREDARYYY